jgi:hypothetical protein
VHTTLTDSAAPIRRWLDPAAPRSPAHHGLREWIGGRSSRSGPRRGQFPPAAVAVSSTDTVSAP